MSIRPDWQFCCSEFFILTGFIHQLLRGALKSLTTMDDTSIFPWSFVNICFIVPHINTSFELLSFTQKWINMNVLYLYLVIFCLKIHFFPDINIATLVFYFVVLVNLFIFELSLSLFSMHLLYRAKTSYSCPSQQSPLLTWKIHTFVFTVTTDIFCFI